MYLDRSAEVPIAKQSTCFVWAISGLLILLLTGHVLGAGLPEDSCWSTFGLKRQSVNNSVHALLHYEGKLIAGGNFTIAHDIIATRVAAWDGSTWSPIGEGLDRSVNALIEFNGQLVAGTTSKVRVWDGQTWSTLGAMNYGYMRVLAVHNGVLFATGSVYLPPDNGYHRVVYWNGNEWVAADSGISRDVTDLVTFDTTLLAASGDGLFQWNGTVWNLVDGFVSGSVFDLQILDNELFVAGRLKVDGATDSTRSLAAWDGTDWRIIPLPHPNVRITALGIFQGKLAISGYWWAGSIPPDPGLIAVWDGATWSEVPMCSRAGSLPVYELLEYDGQLFAGGSFRVADSLPIEFLASWDGSAWHRPGEGINGNINAVASFGDQIIIGGEFTQVGDIAARRIAAWDGFQWHPIGEGFDSTVFDLAVYRGQLIAAGTFTRSGSDSIRALALWDNISWHPLKSDLTFGIGHLDLGGDNLLAGIGYFGRAYIWNGSIWDSTSSFPFSSISAFGSFQGKPVQGTTAQDIWDISRLEFWNGTGWAGKIPGFSPGGIFDLLDDGATLYIGGFEPSLSSWNGTTHTIFPAIGIGVHEISKYNGRIIVGTDDYWDEGFADPLIHQWTGTSWRSLGSGVDANVNDMTVHNGSLVVVGSFGSAGGKVSPYIAAWTEVATDIPDDGRSQLPSGYSLGQNFPNPFNPSTTIRFSLPAAGPVRLDIYNLLGERVRTLVNDHRAAGEHEIVWDGRNDNGGLVSSGLYLYRLNTETAVLSHKMVLLK